MISSFELENTVLNERVTFAQDFDCDFIFPSGSLDWGNVPASHNTYNYPSQIGSSISSTKVNERDISIEGYAFYTPTLEERRLYGSDVNEYAYEIVKEKKRKLNNLINPNDVLRIYIGDYFIEGKPAATPQYGIEESDNNIYFCRFVLTIFCANPMFRRIVDSKNILSGEIGFFRFPFFIKPAGYVMGERINYQVVVVENEGNINVGGKITLLAKGEVVNPTIENIQTGEVIKINKTLNNGEEVVINTSDGEERGIVGTYQGVESSYLLYWDFSNSWFKFNPGVTVVGYSTDNESEELLEVSVDINPAKFGLEDM